MSHTIYVANGKVTFTGPCADEIMPLINRSFVYKAKEGGDVRIFVITFPPYLAELVFNSIAFHKLTHLLLKHYDKQLLGIMK
jgi:hypothetical protein